MKRAILLLMVGAAMLLACAGVVLAQTTTTPSESTSPETTTSTTAQSDAQKSPKEKISGSYIVVLKDNADPEQVVEEKKQKIKDLKVKYLYKAALKGFAVEVPDEEASKLRDHPDVKYVEQDQVMTAIAQDTNPKKSAKRKPGGGSTTPAPQSVPWGINRIDADSSSTLAGNGSGSVSDVNAYVIDTGVDGNHKDLNVDVAGHQNFTGDGKNYDCHGHGTHVAGTIAARDNTQDVVGVAPDVPITGVKVLNCSGSGTSSGVIKGVDWVTANATKPAVANMSLGGGYSQALNAAVQTSADSGVFYSIAAGNDGGDACTKSPASAGLRDLNGDPNDLKNTNNGVMTTGATGSDSSNTEASFSNYGKCVDVYAPGVSIPSTKMGGGTTSMSGTSMAAPHVGGTGALFLSKGVNTSELVESNLRSAAGNGGSLMTNNNHSIDYAGGY